MFAMKKQTQELYLLPICTLKIVCLNFKLRDASLEYPDES